MTNPVLMKPHKLLIALIIKLCLIFFGTLPCKADDSESVASLQQFVETNKTNSIQFFSGISMLSTDLGSANSIDAGFAYRYSLDPKWAMLAQISQGLNMSGFATIFTEIAAGFSYAYRGSHSKLRYESQLNSQTVAKVMPFTPGAIFISGQVKQYLFNGSSNVVPLVGTGVAGYYQFPSDKKLSIQLGSAFDFAQNGDTTLTVIKFFITAGFWL